MWRRVIWYVLRAKCCLHVQDGWWKLSAFPVFGKQIDEKIHGVITKRHTPKTRLHEMDQQEQNVNSNVESEVSEALMWNAVLITKRTAMCQHSAVASRSQSCNYASYMQYRPMYQYTHMQYRPKYQYTHMCNTGPCTSTHTCNTGPCTSTHSCNTGPCTSTHTCNTGPCSSTHTCNTGPCASTHTCNTGPCTSTHTCNTGPCTSTHTCNTGPCTSTHTCNTGPCTSTHTCNTGPCTSTHTCNTGPCTSTQTCMWLALQVFDRILMWWSSHFAWTLSQCLAVPRVLLFLPATAISHSVTNIAVPVCLYAVQFCEAINQWNVWRKCSTERLQTTRHAGWSV
jgi:hypothetical protein